MRKIRLVALLITILLPAYAAAIPHYLSHQGRILQVDQEPLTGVVEVNFALHSQSEGDFVLWSEALDIAFDDGYYSIVLGNLESIPSELFNGADLYLAITVNQEGELEPRQKITTVPYAFMAGEAQSVNGSVTAIGGITVGDTMVIDEGGAWIGPEIDQINSEVLSTYLSENHYLTTDEATTVISDYLIQNNYLTSDGLATVATTGNFSDLLEIPEDLQDGDNDTLATMECAPGEALIQTETGWTCSTFEDTTLSEETVDAFISNNGYALADDLAAIALSGSFSDLTDIPAGLEDGDNEGITGAGSLNILAKFTGEEEIGDSGLVELEGNIGIGTAEPDAKLHVDGNIIANTPTAENHLTTKAYVDALAPDPTFSPSCSGWEESGWASLNECLRDGRMHSLGRFGNGGDCATDMHSILTILNDNDAWGMTVWINLNDNPAYIKGFTNPHTSNNPFTQTGETYLWNSQGGLWVHQVNASDSCIADSDCSFSTCNHWGGHSGGIVWVSSSSFP